ncbi:peptidoglycan DD-metalloendopeptidase family protein [Patescibacteria group bacterium]|nr:peptidoglycan DD-metalloendopeptidase family protein [Patescibacteria group bacterium]
MILKNKVSHILYGAVFIVTLLFIVGLLFFPNPKTTLVTIAEQSIEQLNQEISERKEKIKRLEENTENLEAEIKEKQEEQKNLENQIDILGKEIARAEAEIEKTKTEIEKTRLEIENTEHKIVAKEEEISGQKKLLSEYLRVIHLYDSRSPLEMLLGYDSFSEVLDQAEYLETLENKGQVALDDIQELKAELQWHKRVMESKNEKLSELKDDLEAKKKNLASEKTGKDRLLDITEQQEDKYQELLEQSKKDYEQANTEISNLEADIERVLAERSKNDDSSNQEVQDLNGSGQLAWPINPSRGISAYFMDPSYTKYFGVPHYGVDIPAPQGSTLYAPADGFVVKYRNAGYGYSYLLIYHGGGLSTVYGHIPASLVSEGAYVKKGDPIAKSGGAPGTPGAGWMTTGPHLHFETRVNGKPVNPMNYLK